MSSRSSQERAALLRSSKKLSKVLGEVPRVLDERSTNTDSTWHKRKPNFPLLKISPSPSPINSPTHHRRGSVLSLVSNASSASDVPSESSRRRAKLERLRRKLGDDVPATAIFSETPHAPVPRTPMTATSSYTPYTSRGSIAQADDGRSVTFSISSDESSVAFSARIRLHSPKPHQKHVFQTGPLPPVPPLPAHLTADAADAGLVRPRQKMAAGSKIGGSEFKAARRAKREGRLAEPGEMIEMVGFGW